MLHKHPSSLQQNKTLPNTLGMSKILPGVTFNNITSRVSKTNFLIWHSQQFWLHRFSALPHSFLSLSPPSPFKKNSGIFSFFYFWWCKTFISYLYSCKPNTNVSNSWEKCNKLLVKLCTREFNGEKDYYF